MSTPTEGKGNGMIQVFVMDDSEAIVDDFTVDTEAEVDALRAQLPEGWTVESEDAEDDGWYEQPEDAYLDQMYEDRLIGGDSDLYGEW